MPDPLDLDAIEARANIPALVARVRELEADLHAAGAWAGVRDNAADQADRDAELVERRLNGEIAELRARVREVEAERDERTRQHAARGAEAVAVIDGLRVELANETAKRRAADAVLANIAGWCFRFGKALCPHSGWSDSYGDGVRSMKDEVRTMLQAMRAADLARAGGTK